MEQALLQKQEALLTVGCHFSKHIYLGHGEKEFIIIQTRDGQLMKVFYSLVCLVYQPLNCQSCSSCGLFPGDGTGGSPDSLTCDAQFSLSNPAHSPF